MYSVKSDIKKNRLYITLEGFLKGPEMKECTDRAIEESRKLKSGYDVITDIKNFSPVDNQTVKEIERGQAHFKASNIRRGIRVAGKKVVTNLQFNRLGEQVGYDPDIVETMEEAEKLLNELK